VKFSVFQVSRKGGRQNNEDRMGYIYTRESALFILADGMGGHPEGEVAAELALQSMSALYQREAKPFIRDPHAFLTEALMASHHRIIRYASEKGMLDTPRTTLVACLLQKGVGYWVHCGDSRLYLVRDGLVATRTRDHSYIEQAQSERITQLDRINRNVLFTCLGSPSKPIFDVSGPTQMLQGDRLLLCSDGLWSSLEDHEIGKTMHAFQVAEAVPELVEQALRKAGPTSDNVTAVGVEWETPDHFESTTKGISTEDISDGVFASTIQSGILGTTGVDDLDDAAIERQIAEINEAIRRSKKG
jgi:PPM family protein phosphatase